MRRRIRKTKATLIYTYQDAQQGKEIGGLMPKLEPEEENAPESAFQIMQPKLSWNNPMKSYRGWRGYSIVDTP